MKKLLFAMILFASCQKAEQPTPAVPTPPGNTPPSGGGTIITPMRCKIIAELTSMNSHTYIVAYPADYDKTTGGWPVELKVESQTNTFGTTAHYVENGQHLARIPNMPDKRTIYFTAINANGNRQNIEASK